MVVSWVSTDVCISTTKDFGQHECFLGYNLLYVEAATMIPNMVHKYLLIQVLDIQYYKNKLKVHN